MNTALQRVDEFCFESIWPNYGLIAYDPPGI